MPDPIDPQQGASYSADQPTANEQLLNSAIYHGLSLERVNAGMAKEIRQLLIDAQEQITAKLATGKMTDWQTQRAQQFLDWSNKVIAKTYDKIDSSVADNLDGIKEAEIAKQTNAVNSAIGVEISPAMSTQQLEAIAKADELLVNGAVMGDWWKKQAGNLQHQIKTTVQGGLVQGQSTQDIAKAIKEFMPTADDISDKQAAAQATTLARTAAATVQSEAQQAYYKENSDIMKGVRWVSTLDSRTTPQCQALDGSSWQVDQKGEMVPVGHDIEWPGYPPIHWNCRSTTVPVLKSWQELSKKELPHLDDQTVETIFKQKLADQGFTADQIANIEMNQRASVDGAVPAGTTYEDWLGKQPENVQKTILGPAKWQLWHDGQLSLADMINKQTMEPLTVDELKAAALQNKAIPPPPPPVEGKYGLSLPEHQILTAQMTSGATSGEAWSSWYNPENGIRIDQALKSTLSQSENAQLQAQDKLIQLTNSNSNTQFWNKSDAKLWASQPGFSAAKLVTPSGRVITAKLKPGKTWTASDADTYGQKLWENRRRGMDEFRAQADAFGSTGKMTVTQTQPGALALDSSTMKKVYGPVHVEDKPLSFLEAHANLEQLQKDAALNAAHQEVAAQLKAAAEAQDTYTEESQKAREKQAELQTKIAERDLEAAQKAKEESDASIAAHEEALAKAKAAAEAAAKAAAEAAAAEKAKALALATQAKADAFKAQDELDKEKAKQEAAAKALAAQQAALDAKKAEEKAIKKAKAEAKKAAKLAKLQAAAVNTQGQMDLALEPKVESKTNFPADPNTLKVTKSLPGSTGAQLVEDADGNKYVRKKDTNKGQVNDEFVADEVYRAAGIPVPEAKLYSTADGPVKLSKYIEGGKQLNDYLAGASQVEKNQVLGQIRRSFVTDAWLGNWDVAGLNLDNILVDPNGNAWHIDNGGSLRYRGMGSLKTAAQFGNTVTELDTLRNPAIAPQASQLFKGISDQEIVDQAVKLYTQRDKLLALFPAELQAKMAARLDYIDQYATELVAAGKAKMPVITGAPAVAAPPKPKLPEWASDKQIENINESGITAYSLWSDKDKIEDAQTMAWTEKNLQKKVETVAQVKLQPEAMAELEALLKPLLPNTPSAYTSAVAANTLPTDNYYQPILAAVKTINVHVNDANYNVTTVAGAMSKKSGLEWLVLHGTANEQKMADQYLQVLDKIENATLAKSTGKLPSIATFNQYEIPPAAAPTAAPSAGPVQWKVTSTTADFKTKLLDNGNAKQGTGTSFKANYAQAYLIDMGDVQARYIPGGSVNNEIWALQGQLELRTLGDASPETMKRIEGAFKELGLDMTPPTDEYKKAVYLSKNIYFNDKSTMPPDVLKLLKDGTISDAERLQKIEGIVAQRYPSFELKPGDDRWKGETAQDGDGHRTFLRSDMTKQQIATDMQGYVLAHSTSTSLPTLVEALMKSGGQVTSTTERIRKGISLSRTGGMSSEADLKTGGASYLFTRIRQTDSVGGGTIIFDIDNLARLDAYSYNGDYYGNVKEQSRRQSRATTISEYKSYASNGSNETIFKNGFDVTQVKYFVTNNDTEKQEVIATLKKYGIVRMADGRPVEQAVLKSYDKF